MPYLEHMGMIGMALAILSVIAVTIIMERILFFARLQKTQHCPLLKQISTTLANNSKQPKDIRDQLASFLLIAVRDSFEFGIRILRIIAVVSPMVGLLGTVIGIIESFKTIALHKGPVYPALIADGLWTAMLTTAFGLVIALPCLLAAFLFSRMAEKRIRLYQNQLNNQSFQIEGVTLD